MDLSLLFVLTTCLPSFDHEQRSEIGSCVQNSNRVSRRMIKVEWTSLPYYYDSPVVLHTKWSTKNANNKRLNILSKNKKCSHIPHLSTCWCQDILFVFGKGRGCVICLDTFSVHHPALIPVIAFRFNSSIRKEYQTNVGQYSEDMDFFALFRPLAHTSWIESLVLFTL